MAPRNPNVSSFFLLLTAATLQAVITVCNGATLPTVSHSGTTAPTMTTAEPPPNSCASSNFQLPEDKPDSHVILNPLQSMTLSALTISFTAKIKKETGIPTVISYSVKKRTKFFLELPGSDSEAGYWIGLADGVYCGDSADEPFPIDSWNQVTATWNGKTGQYAIYVNETAVVSPDQDDECKASIRRSRGAKFVLGGKKQSGSSKLASDSRFIGSIINMQMWPFAFNESQLQALWAGNFSHPGTPLLDHPPTYENELISGSRCDKECQPGQYVVQHNGSEIKCADCPAGKFSNDIGSHSCTECGPGMHSASPGSQNCTLCEAGHFQNESAQAACEICPAGEFSDKVSSHSCTKCSPGMHSASQGSQNCTLCAAGHFQDKSGQSDCKQCPAGHYSLSSGSKLCLKCPANLPSIEKPPYIQCLDGKFTTLEDLVESAVQKHMTDTDQQLEEVQEEYEKLQKADNETVAELKLIKEADTTMGEELKRMSVDTSAQLDRITKENNQMAKELEECGTCSIFAKCIKKSDRMVCQCEAGYKGDGKDCQREGFTITEDGKTWIVIQKREFVSHHDGFKKDWSQYKSGFGEPYAYWMGLEKMHQLTKSGRWELLIMAKYNSGSYSGQWGKGVYDNLKIGNEASGYQLTFGTRLKNEKNGGNLDYHKNSKFSTTDNDNDQWSSNCAASSSHGAGAGWWYNACYGSRLNSFDGQLYYTSTKTLMAMRKK